MGFNNNRWFDINIKEFKNIEEKNRKELFDMIIYHLNNSFYLLQRVDESFLGINNQKEKLTNLVLIHGYDLNRKSFNLLSYDNNGIYRSRNESIDSYFNSINKSDESIFICFIKKRMAWTLILI